jgi:hypothetical protein
MTFEIVGAENSSEEDILAEEIKNGAHLDLVHAQCII